MLLNRPLKNYWVVDIETDGLLHEVSKIHCVVFINAQTSESYTYRSDITGSIDESYTQLLRVLNSKDHYIVAHNASYDLGVYYKLYGLDILKYTRKIIDTIHLSSLMFPKHILAKHKLNKNIPKTKLGKKDISMCESPSLKAWSYRLNPDNTKIEYDEGWGELTDNMVKYCEKDVEVTVSILKYFLDNSYKPSDDVLNLEVYLSFLFSIQTITGWRIDVESLNKIMSKCRIKISQIDLKLSGSFIPFFVHTGSTDKLRNSSKWEEVTLSTPRSILKCITSPVAYFKNGKPKQKKHSTFKIGLDRLFYRKINIAYVGERSDITLEYFKAGSRQSILKFMKLKYNWTPSVYTPTLNYKLDSDTFKNLPYTEAKLLSERFKINKTLSEATSIYNSLIKDRVHPSTNVMGTNTFRTTSGGSGSINIAQINSKGGFRSLFLADKDMVMVGADESGAELVMLGEFLLPYDNGRLQHIKAHEDIHQSNADLVGIERQSAKVLVFSSIYGSSHTLTGYSLWFDGCVNIKDIEDTKYDKIMDKLKRRCTVHNDKLLYPIKKGMFIELTSKLVFQTIYGEIVQNKLKEGILGYKDLENTLKSDYKNKGYTTTLDGRRIYLKSPHSALNYLLQSSNAIFTKYWIMHINTIMRDKGYKLGIDYTSLASVYDEYQTCCKHSVLNALESAYNDACTITNRQLLKSKMEIDVQHGTSWQSTH